MRELWGLSSSSHQEWLVPVSLLSLLSEADRDGQVILMEVTGMGMCPQRRHWTEGEVVEQGTTEQVHGNNIQGSKERELL